MITIEVDDFGKIYQKYIKRLEAGETILLTRKGKPVAEITPTPQNLKNLRPFGLSASKFVTPDDFNNPLPAELLDAFEGK
ncbi:type II toxin-antitoxin system Phd/YefM family antitoxin [Candidatus Leptofilum sp.]|uniref:type II toxin-antitoxin system Phd/YefM family antitoxin n=1 Tax=Candidatus Leptofilum sp. TaxID=3241576 RepID=UPI003B5BC378